MVPEVASLSAYSFFGGGLLDDEQLTSAFVFNQFLQLVLGKVPRFLLLNVLDEFEELRQFVDVCEAELLLYFIERFEPHRLPIEHKSEFKGVL